MLFLFNVKMRCKLLSWEAREGHRHSVSLKTRGVASPKTLSLKIGSQTICLFTLSFSCPVYEWTLISLDWRSSSFGLNTFQWWRAHHYTFHFLKPPSLKIILTLVQNRCLYYWCGLYFLSCSLSPSFLYFFNLLVWPKKYLKIIITSYSFAEAFFMLVTQPLRDEWVNGFLLMLYRCCFSWDRLSLWTRMFRAPHTFLPYSLPHSEPRKYLAHNGLSVPGCWMSEWMNECMNE